MRRCFFLSMPRLAAHAEAEGLVGFKGCRASGCRGAQNLPVTDRIRHAKDSVSTSHEMHCAKAPVHPAAEVGLRLGRLATSPKWHTTLLRSLGRQMLMMQLSRGTSCAPCVQNRSESSSSS